MIFLSKKIYILYLVSLSGLISSYTNASENKCQSDNINQNLNCIFKNNVLLEMN